MNRTALLLSAVLTAFVLVLTGGIVARMTAAPAAAQAAPAEQPGPSSAAPAAARASGGAPAALAVSEIDAETAARLALQAAPGAVLRRQPELVNFEGVRAYEVTLDQGTLYLDAATGAVLHDGRAMVAAQATYHDDDYDDGDDHEQHEQHEAEEHEDDDD